MISLATESTPTVCVKHSPGGHRLCCAGTDVSVTDANDLLEALSIRGLSPATIRAYAFDLVVLYRWLQQAHRQIADLDSAELLRFIEYQQQLGAKPATINRRLVTCEQLYRFVTGNPINSTRIGAPAHHKGRGRDRHLGLHRLKRIARRKLRVKVPHKLVEPLTPAQVGTLLQHLRRYRDLAIIYLMLLCGLRSAEVLLLRVADVDATERRLRILGKGNRERVLPLADVLARMISNYRHFERPSNTPTDHLFVVLQGTRRGRQMTAAGLRSLFRHRRAMTKQLANANAHRLRHTFGTDMARAGVRLPILQRMMGHADGKTTLQYINLSMTDIATEYSRAIDTIAKRYQDVP